MNNIYVVRPMPCRRCGSNSIGVKDRVVTTPDKNLAHVTWAYCRKCGHKGKETMLISNITDEIEIAEAMSVWNEKG
ncbi:hypothetical protein [Butyrivibrio sp.]|uniref:hypothetical protein n=1 Tax=Butyrivibrio sp. TaxID=28121 RepID=UPI0025BAEC16|nr:hypothetical protein [Butyrivibrio sp.]MBQ7431156.1 hypothetical protein [Butyrivibrio sp.]MBQ9302524.1 hypothetical protein [Butyrivibrio sp.]